MEAPTQVNQPTSHKIETSYRAIGDYKRSIPEYVGETVRQQGEKHGNKQENSLYLNSSDSLEMLLKQDFSGQRIMTVSGSGEFAHAFIHGGASEIVSFDVSPAAAFNSELRHVALCNLSMDDYIKLFGSWADGDMWHKDGTTDIWDKEVYKKIETSLSSEARTYFDLLFKKPELIKYDKYEWSGFARVRFNKKTKANRLVGDIIKSKAEYNELQAKARKVKFSQIICEANELRTYVSKFRPDTVYISNIGYYPDKIFAIAKKYATRGVSQVICCVSSNETDFNDTTGKFGYDHSGCYYFDKKVLPGDKFTYQYRERESYKVQSVDVELLGIDKNADYGLIFRVRSQ